MLALISTQENTSCYGTLVTHYREQSLTWAPVSFSGGCRGMFCLCFTNLSQGCVQATEVLSEPRKHLIPFRKDKRIRCPWDFDKCIASGFD